MLAHRLDGITLRITDRDEQLLEVRRNRCRWDVARSRVVDPLRFRIALARACADPERYGATTLLGVRFTESLEATLSVGPPGDDLGFGAVRVLCGDRTVWAFASLLEPTEVTSVLRGVGVDLAIAAGPGCRISARVVHDDLLDATVVHVDAGGSAPTDVADEVLRTIVAALGAAELVGAFA